MPVELPRSQLRLGDGGLRVHHAEREAKDQGLQGNHERLRGKSTEIYATVLLPGLTGFRTDVLG